MPRYDITPIAEGYTLIQTEGRWYPMTITFKEEGVLVPEVSPIILDGQPVSYVKRATAASYTWKHKVQEGLKRVPEVSPPPPLLNPPLCEVCHEQPSTLEIDYIDSSKEGDEKYRGVLGCTQCVYTLKETIAPHGLITPIEYAFPRQDLSPQVE